MKTLKEGSGEEDRVKFLQEAAIMGQFKHPNVVNMFGVVTNGEPVSYFLLAMYTLFKHYVIRKINNDWMITSTLACIFFKDTVGLGTTD